MKKYCRKSGQIPDLNCNFTWNPYFGSDRKGGWHLLTTKDMVHYGPESAIGILGETGSVIWADGLF